MIDFFIASPCGPPEVLIKSQETMLAEGTTAFEAWEVVPAPVYMSYYFYNITNADAFLSNFNGATKPDPPVKPYLEEIGPYTFRWVQKETK